MVAQLQSAAASTASTASTGRPEAAEAAFEAVFKAGEEEENGKVDCDGARSASASASASSDSEAKLSGREGTTTLATAQAQARLKKIQQLEGRIPGYISSSLLSILVFILGATMKADWLLFLSLSRKSLQTETLSTSGSGPDDATSGSGSGLNASSPVWNDQVALFLEQRLHGLWPAFIVPAFAVSYVMFFGVGGFLHYYYYIGQRSQSSLWKCQPNSWLSPSLELHEMAVGAFSLGLGSFFSSCLACYVTNDGPSGIYYDPGQYGYVWLVLQAPVIFVFQDYLTYWGHRLFHTPWLYRHFHKLHHTYKHPTAFSATAMHPVEFCFFNAIYVAPMFLFNVHWVPFCALLIYIYYHGLIDHSGINFKRKWWQPWQPDCIFHDNHHQYFHVNFGFNIEYWDKLHGTVRQRDRLYNEDTFYGRGKSLQEATAAELAGDVTEREAENPLAYTQNKLKFGLTQREIEQLEMARKMA